MPAVPTHATRKRRLGQYYTPQGLAEYLAEEAILGADWAVMDPAFGQGALLKAAGEVLRAKGSASPEAQLFGVDLDPKAADSLALALNGRVIKSHFLRADFLRTPVTAFGRKFQCILGNPPFVRLHMMSKAQREAARGLARARNAIVSGRASSWAYFVLHSMAFLERGGTLAMILPRALVFTDYGKQLLSLVSNSFSKTRLLEVLGQPFEDAEERIILLIARGYGQGPGPIEHLEMAKPGVVQQPTLALVSANADGRNLPAPWLEGPLASLKGKRHVDSLGDWFDVRIGVVTGANDFFLLGKKNTAYYSVPRWAVGPIVSRASMIRGVEFNSADFSRLWDAGQARKLLLIETQAQLPAATKRYLKMGRERGIPDRFKCVSRSKWYAIEDARIPDAFFHYCAASVPHVVLNRTRSTCTNAIHRLFWKKGRRPTDDAARCFSLSSITSVTQLAAECIGRTYGGGVLKLEPSEVKRLPIVVPRETPAELTSLYRNVDEALREGRREEAMELTDTHLLVEGGLVTSEEVNRFRAKWKSLATHRLDNSHHNGSFSR